MRRKAAAAVESGAARAVAGVGPVPAATAARRRAGARVWRRRHMVPACVCSQVAAAAVSGGRLKWSGDGQARFDLTERGEMEATAYGVGGGQEDSEGGGWCALRFVWV